MASFSISTAVVQSGNSKQQNSGCSPCIKLCHISNFDLSLSLSLSLLLGTQHMNCILLFFLLAYAKECAYTFANFCFEFELEYQRTFQYKYFQIFLYKQITRWISSSIKNTLQSNKLYIILIIIQFYSGISKMIHLIYASN